MGIKKDPFQTTMRINVLGGETRKKKVHRVSFKLLPMKSKYDSNVTEIQAWTVNNVCGPLEGIKFNKNQCIHLKNLELADNYPRGQAAVDLLIGADQYYNLVQGGIKRGKLSEPVATSSKLGWLLSGPVAGSFAVKNQTTSMLTVSKLEQPRCELERFWELDAIGISDETRYSKYTRDEEQAIYQFNKDTTFDNERYTVGLPWKENHPVLIDNYKQAEERLIAVEKSLQRNPEKAKAYCNAMMQYIKDGHAREVNDDDDHADQIRYLPHHAVFRADRATTKCRVVFDASSETPDRVSLNSCLLKGPKLQPDLVQVLIRFRSRKVALMADIKKMFLQIQLKRKDQNSHRFLWRDLEINKKPKKYCMTRVTFGSTSSPFLSIATVQKHARDHKEEYPRAAEEILENMYVDDLLSGSEDDASALEMKCELTELMYIGGFHLTKWASNSMSVMKSIPDEEIAPEVVTHAVISGNNEAEKMSDLLKALGISWDITKDVFLFQSWSSLLQIPDALTKRSLLSLYPRLFDPLGFLTPYLMRPKLLFQELWNRKRDWDDPLDADIAQSWNT